jgi:type IV secretory pathway TrbD component
MTAPAPNPVRKLHRVINVARADSMAVLFCSGASLVISILQANWVFAIFSVLAIVAGLMERQGARLLDDGFAAGIAWLPGSQGVLFTVVIGYVAWRWKHFDPSAYWAEIPVAAQQKILDQMRASGLDPEADREPLLRVMNGLMCFTLGVVTLLYQGGLALWYRLQQHYVLAALQNPSTPPELPR